MRKTQEKIVGNEELYNRAEYKAIKDSITKISLHNQLVEATIYTSCEPCLMYLGAILYEGITRIEFYAIIQDIMTFIAKKLLFQ